MSASKEKKTRNEQRAAGTEKKQNAANEQELSAKKFRRNAIIAVICIVLVVAAALVINSSLFYTKMTAVTIGNTDYSAAEVDVFYRNTYTNLYNSYGQLASYVFDTSTPLTQQQYNEGQSWADYIYELTLENMKQITALYDAAMAEGYTVTDTDRAMVDSQIESMRSAAASNGVSNLDQFLAAVYGKGVSSKVVESVLTKIIVAQNYSQSKIDSLTYTPEELSAYYDAHTADLDFFHFYYYLVNTADSRYDDLSDGEKKNEAHKAAVAIADAADLDAFKANVDAYTEGALAGEQYAQRSSLTGYEYLDWVTDAGRKFGDTATFDSDSGSYALFYVERDDNHYPSRSMRHILINTEADENYEYTDEAKELALARIESIEAEWKENPTEEHFAELANRYSEDTGSNTEGGLYENIRKHQMVTNINTFLFEEDHKPGDTAIVYGESGSYQGYHLVYYVGDGENYSDYLAEDALRSEDYNTWITNLIANYNVTEGSGKSRIYLS